MSNEIRITHSVFVSNGNSNYQTPAKNTSFQANQTTAFGPVPGAVTVTVAGVDIDLSALPSYGGVCELTNNDSTNFVTYGVKSGGTFYPWGELGPGESYPARLSRFIRWGMTGTANVQTFHMQADTASCIVQVMVMAK